MTSSLLKPWLWLPPRWSHDLSPYLLPLISQVPSGLSPSWNGFQWGDLNFRNPLGVAGGVDKNAQQIGAWNQLGAGFVEIGTITPEPQQPNPGVILQRNFPSQALWNQMGFPNRGVNEILQKLKNLPKPHAIPLFANIGKNRSTPLREAHEDYIKCVRRLYSEVDAFVINISSPNTKSLRELLEPKNLKSFLEPILFEGQRLATQKSFASSKPRPFLLKLSPDMDEAQLKEVLTLSMDVGISGWILTNTTLHRSNDSQWPEHGGVSGRPLAQLSKRMLSQTIEFLGTRRNEKLIISAGGILSPEDVFHRIELGAHLVQVYTALVFQGPFFFRQVAKYSRKITTPPKN